MKRHPWRVAIIGAGKVGLTFGRILRDRGDRIVAVVSRTPESAAQGGKFLHCPAKGTSLEILPRELDLLLITTPHAAVIPTALALSRLENPALATVAACHASGMLTASALDPLAQRGATVFSFHPLQTFPRDFAVPAIIPTLRGIWYGVDGPAPGLAIAGRLARRLGGNAVVIPPERRVLYHAACVVASNHLTALLHVLESMHGALGTENTDVGSLFKPIIDTTLRNVFLTSPARALSGPVARGGSETLAGHLAAIRAAVPGLLRYTCAMTEETLVLAERKGSVDPAQAQAIRQLLQSYSDIPTSGRNRT